ncbi:unnamed protein product [Gongylonema pulchrum]|uniref:Col_cuticle_N domain-containing protein n=1 Tax=Gongylonema pulchrum TaxID=637853 RepID=A0A183DZ72_9BILA|nr:unnamed protein product [Gongylonema pulchrum]
MISHQEQDESNNVQLLPLRPTQRVTTNSDPMPKQIFELIDYLGPLAVSVAFIIALFLISLIINFLWITKEDDRTVFEKKKEEAVELGRIRSREWEGEQQDYCMVELGERCDGLGQESSRH